MSFHHKTITSIVVLSLILASHTVAQSPKETAHSSFTPYVAIDFQIVDKHSLRVKGLKKEMLQVNENGTVKTVFSLTEESNPLAIVLVLMMGSDPYCFLDFDQFLTFLNDSLAEHLRLEDKVALVVATEDPAMPLTFSTSRQERNAILGTRESPSSTLYRLNCDVGIEKKILAGRDLFGRKDSGGSGLEFYERKIIFAQENQGHRAMQKALDYLKTQNIAGYRPTVILCNSLYNLKEAALGEKFALKNQIRNENIIVNWIGEPLEILRTEDYYSKPASTPVTKRGRQKDENEWWDWGYARWRGRDYYISLVDGTGGMSKTCEPFHPDRYGNEKKRYNEFQALVKNLLENLRTRYRITYKSDNPDLTKPRNIKLEMSPKWKGGKVVLHYPQMIYPQADRK